MSKEAMKLALKKIATVNAMDYEYQAWAKEALAEQPAQQEFVSPGGGYVPAIPAQQPAQQELVACQYAKDVAMPEYRCVGRCQYDTSPPAQQNPVALKWQQAPIRTAWGDEMVVASVAIDKDHTLSLYCERDQAPKVEAMFAQRTWVGLTDEEIGAIDTSEFWDDHTPLDFARAIEAALRSKNA